MGQFWPVFWGKTNPVLTYGLRAPVKSAFRANLHLPTKYTKTKQGTSCPRCLVPFILSNELFKPIRIPFLPVPAIPDHLIDPVLSTPAKFALGFRGVRVNDRNIAGTTAINDIRDLDAIHAFKGFYELQNAVALPCSKVVHCETTVVLDRLESVYVASGEVHDVDVVPDAGVIRCLFNICKLVCYSIMNYIIIELTIHW